MFTHCLVVGQIVVPLTKVRQFPQLSVVAQHDGVLMHFRSEEHQPKPLGHTHFWSAQS